MKKAIQAALALTIAIGGMLSYAQDGMPVGNQLPTAPQPQKLLALIDSGDVMNSGTLPSNYSLSSSSTGSIREPPASPIHAHVFDRYYNLVTAAHLGMAIFDVAMTQHCEAQHTCRETNPFMPSSRAGQIGVSFGFFAYSATGSYFLKKHKSKAWWVPSAMGITTHAIGVATGFSHQ
jgi:hypothetical protein